MAECFLKGTHSYRLRNTEWRTVRENNKRAQCGELSGIFSTIHSWIKSAHMSGSCAVWKKGFLLKSGMPTLATYMILWTYSLMRLLQHEGNRWTENRWTENTLPYFFCNWQRTSAESAHVSHVAVVINLLMDGWLKCVFAARTTLTLMWLYTFFWGLHQRDVLGDFQQGCI